MLYIAIGLVALVLFPALRAFVFLCGVFAAVIMGCVIVYVKLFPNQDPCSSFQDTVSQYEYWGNIARNVDPTRPFMFNAVEQVEVCENHLQGKFKQQLDNMPYAERQVFDHNRADILNKVVFSYDKLYRIKANQIIRDIKKENR